MENKIEHIGFFKRSIVGFVAGFLATITFHQVALWVMHSAGIAPFSPYNMTAIPPWGVPAVISLSFWGGVWGIVFAWVYGMFPPRNWFWVTSFLFGALFPSLVALMIIGPLKGRMIGVGWNWQLLLTVFLINGVWGFGTAAFLYLYEKMSVSHKLLTPKCGPGMLCEE
jgi:hypothetical protein